MVLLNRILDDSLKNFTDEKLVAKVRLEKIVNLINKLTTSLEDPATYVISGDALREIHENMRLEAEESGAGIDALYYCPHGWNDGCECRKPGPGMLFQAQHDFHIDLTRTYFIGDDIRDKQAGNSAGCKIILVSSDISLLKVVKEKILSTKTHNSSVIF